MPGRRKRRRRQQQPPPPAKNRAAVYVDELLPPPERTAQLNKLLLATLGQTPPFEAITIYGSPPSDADDATHDITARLQEHGTAVAFGIT